jgi:hypothetical protein
LEEGFKPTRGPTYTLNKKQDEEMNKFIDENLKLGHIRPSKSPQSSLFFFVEKKGDTKNRPTQDYWKLNNSTKIGLIHTQLLYTATLGLDIPFAKALAPNNFQLF